MMNYKIIVKKLLVLKVKNIILAVTLCVIFILISSFVIKTQKYIDRNVKKQIQLPNYNVHIFYDGGYRNPIQDAEYVQWIYNDNDLVKATHKMYYPLLGLYSSNNETIIDLHMQQISSIKVGVVIVQWWPKEHRDAPNMHLLFDYAHKYNLKVTIHIQNYPNRNITNLHQNLYYFFQEFRHHPALYWCNFQFKILPLIYIYQSQSIPMIYWNQLLGSTSSYTIRSTHMDAFYISQIENELDQYLVLHSDFDGFYTYNPLFNDTYATKWTNWPYIQDFARKEKAIFIPTVSPGTILLKSRNDTREIGAYYATSWMRAVVSRAKFISINSFNNWIDATQIEPAVPHTSHLEQELQYANYEPNDPNYYLTITNSWVSIFTNRSLYREH